MLVDADFIFLFLVLVRFECSFVGVLALSLSFVSVRTAAVDNAVVGSGPDGDPGL